MRCKDCKHFKIEYEPYKSGGVCWDFGLARCLKHDLVTDVNAFLDGLSAAYEAIQAAPTIISAEEGE